MVWLRSFVFVSLYIVTIYNRLTSYLFLLTVIVKKLQLHSRGLALLIQHHNSDTSNRLSHRIYTKDSIKLNLRLIIFLTKFTKMGNKEGMVFGEEKVVKPGQLKQMKPGCLEKGAALRSSVRQQLH